MTMLQWRRPPGLRFLAYFLLAAAAWAGEWSDAVEVRHEEEVAVSYQARLDGPWLVVRAKVGPGWHTFAMDNKRRADEKLAGKPAISVDRPTGIAPAGLEIAGPWYQSPPKDFSRPELRWFSWGFEKEAMFAAKVRRGSSGRVTVKGQACTETVCKNIDVTVKVPAAKSSTAAELNIKDLIEVR